MGQEGHKINLLEKKKMPNRTSCAHWPWICGFHFLTQKKEFLWSLLTGLFPHSFLDSGRDSCAYSVIDGRFVSTSSPSPPSSYAETLLLLPTPCDIRRWGLWELVRISWGQEGGALTIGSTTLQGSRESLLSLLCSLPCEDHGKSRTWERAVTKTWLKKKPSSQISTTVRNVCCL